MPRVSHSGGALSNEELHVLS